MIVERTSDGLAKRGVALLRTASHDGARLGSGVPWNEFQGTHSVAHYFVDGGADLTVLTPHLMGPPQSHLVR